MRKDKNFKLGLLRAIGKQVLLTCAFFILCGIAKAQGERDISPVAREYLTQALDIMEQKSLLKRQIKWRDLRLRTFKKAVGAQEPVDTYEAIRFAFKAIGDNHSFLQLNDQLQNREFARRKRVPNNTVQLNTRGSSPYEKRRQPEGFLHKTGNCLVPHVVVPLTPFRDISVMSVFAAALHEFIVDADKKAPCGWIVDLRGNGGGAVFPMLGGVGALLEEGDIMYALDADGGKTYFWYRGGRSGVRQPDGKELIFTKVESDSYRVKKDLPIAVLIDRGTGSSGELIAIAFRNRNSTRFFGEKTFGATTTTEGFKLKDGANLVIATGVDVDRNGKIYPSGIKPDEIIPIGDKVLPSNVDPVVRAALVWLKKQSP